MIQILESLLCSPGNVLITADMSSIYTIIGHQDAVSLVEWALEKSCLSCAHKKTLYPVSGFLF